MSNEKFTERLKNLFSNSTPITPEPVSDGLKKTVDVQNVPLDSTVSLTTTDQKSERVLESRDIVEHAEKADLLIISTLQFIRDRFGLERVFFYQVDSAGQKLVLKHSVGEERKSTEQKRKLIPINEKTLIGRSALEKKSFYDETFRKNGAGPKLAFAAFCVPLLLDHRLLGVLELQSVNNEVFTPLANLEMELTAYRLAKSLGESLEEQDSQSTKPDDRWVEIKPSEEYRKKQVFQTHHADFLGYIFDQKKVKPLGIQEINAIDTQEEALKTPIKIGDENIGVIELAASRGRQWTPEEEEAIQIVSQRLSQHIKTLRLLEDAEKYQYEAEQAFQQLSQQGWEKFLLDHEKTGLGYCFDQEQVIPIKDRSFIPDQDVLTLDLHARERKIGTIWMEGENDIHPDTMPCVKTICDRLSVHIDALRLNEQREQALSESELLYQISSSLSASATFVEILDAMSQPAISANADHAQLFMVEKDANEESVGVELIAIWNKEGGQIPYPVGARYNFSDLISHRSLMVNPREMLISSDVNSDDYLDQKTKVSFSRRDIQAVAILPLWIGDDWVGVALFNWNRPHQFTDLEKRLYRAVSGQAAVVMHNLLLLEQTRKRAKELETVAKVSTVMSRLLSPGDLLQSVVDLTKFNFNLYHVQIFLLDDKGITLSIGAGSGSVGTRMIDEGRLVRVENGKSPVARAARRRESILINDVWRDPNFVQHPLLPETSSELVIPMVLGESLIGVLDVQSADLNRFTSDDVRIFSTLAAQVAVALQNAKLYAEQAATVERLRELDHLKSDFLANMSHELRTPLNSILGFVDVLLMGLDGPISEQMEDDLQRVSRNGNHLLSMINDILDMAKIEAGRLSLNLEEFDLLEILSEVIDILDPLAKEKSLKLDLEFEQESIMITADRLRLTRVFINLLGNAVKFTEQGGVSMHAVKNEDKVTIFVRDTGLGIPQEKRNYIFESFSQLDTTSTRKAGGTGLGLPISRGIIEMHHGRIWVESAGIPGQGSTFFVELPVDQPDHSTTD